jgi:hypothetical protein
LIVFHTILQNEETSGLEEVEDMGREEEVEDMGWV